MKIHSVNRVKGGNRWCGPAVISAVTRCTTDEASKAIRYHSGQHAVRGCYTHHLQQALKSHWGVESVRVRSYRWTPPSERPTLAKWLRDSKDIRTAGRVFLVVAGRHFQLVSGRRYVCSQTTDVVSVRAAPHRRARVEEVYELTGTPKLTVEGKSYLRAKPKPKPQSNRTIAKRLAAKWGISIEIENSDPDDLMAWVDAPFLSEDEDPLYDNHYGFGWWEIREKVETLAEYLSANGYHPV